MEATQQSIEVAPQSVSFVGKPNQDVLALIRDADGAVTATWDAELARLLTAQPNWPT